MQIRFGEDDCACVLEVGYHLAVMNVLECCEGLHACACGEVFCCVVVF